VTWGGQVVHVRHWTREDLLSPVASHHSGTGRHRKYDASSVSDAAILKAVARAGLHVVMQLYRLEALSAARAPERPPPDCPDMPPRLDVAGCANGAPRASSHDGEAGAMDISKNIQAMRAFRGHSV
jgi:hypothetical protein